MRRPKPVLTDQELEIMKIVWHRGQVTVRDVYEELLAKRKIAYTTVMTMMGILESKKYLRKSQEERAYVYKPTRPQTEVVSGMVRDFVNRLFNGSAKPLMVHLAENEQFTPEELAEIRRLLQEKQQ
jgi:predicted transcriptional regulator